MRKRIKLFIKKSLFIMISLSLISCSPLSKDNSPTLNRLSGCDNYIFYAGSIHGSKQDAERAMYQLAMKYEADFIQILKMVPPHFMVDGRFNPTYVINGIFYVCHTKKIKIKKSGSKKIVTTNPKIRKNFWIVNRHFRNLFSA